MSSAFTHKLKVMVNGNLYLVEVGDLNSSPITVKVNGQLYTVDIETAEIDQSPVAEPAVASEAATLEAPTPEKMPRSTGPDGPTQNAVKAPMPGKITAVAVKPGDRVTVGQELCSLEAMKMNNVIRSPRAGVIASVKITHGQDVNQGDILLYLLR